MARCCRAEIGLFGSKCCTSANARTRWRIHGQIHQQLVRTAADDEPTKRTCVPDPLHLPTPRANGHLKLVPRAWNVTAFRRGKEI